MTSRQCNWSMKGLEILRQLRWVGRPQAGDDANSRQGKETILEIRTEEFHRGKVDNARTTILQRRRGEPGTPQPARRRVADSPRTLHRESTGTTGTGHRGDRRPPGRGGRTPSEEAGAATLARTPAVAGPSPKRLALFPASVGRHRGTQMRRRT